VTGVQTCFRSEGGLGLNDTETYLKRWMEWRNINTIVMDDLYKNPDQILAIKYLEPTILVIGTTGTYQEEMEVIYNKFKQTKYLPDHVFITIGINGMRDFIRESLSLNPTIQFWKVFGWDKEDIIVEKYPRYELPL